MAGTASTIAAPSDANQCDLQTLISASDIGAVREPHYGRTRSFVSIAVFAIVGAHTRRRTIAIRHVCFRVEQNGIDRFSLGDACHGEAALAALRRLERERLVAQTRAGELRGDVVAHDELRLAHSGE